MRAVVAVDVGGTSIKGNLVAASGQLLAEQRAPTPVASGPDGVVAAIRGFTQDLVARATADGTEVAAVGVVVPGSVDAAGGVARFAANLGWRDVPLRDLIAETTGRPTVLDHDVRAAGVAEATIGRTGGSADSLLAVIGTGIAGVLTVDGQVVSGATGVAGEIGHLPVWPDGELCPCGQRGCLERYASAASIERHYREQTGRTAGAEEVAALVPTDPVAASVWGQAVDSLAIGLASCTMLADPALIVIGGGLSHAGGLLLEPLRAAVDGRVRWRPSPPIELSDLGARAGVLGAAILAFRAAGLDDYRTWGR